MKKKAIIPIIKSRILLVSASLVLSLCMMSYMMSNDGSGDPRGSAYAGAAACQQCHKAVYDSFLLTAHNMASMPGSTKTVFANFKQQQNSFPFLANSEVKIESSADTVFETLYENNQLQAAFPIDMVFGLKNGQTFLYWYGDNAYQLPITYYHSANKLGTSPGYSILVPDFSRKIGRNCFECHSSYIDILNDTEKTMNRNSLVYGIDCEACHGPAKSHVNYHIKYPDEKNAMHLLKKQDLSAQQQLDLCAYCHCNDADQIKSRFLFKPGDVLSDYFLHTTDHDNVDVHGDQLGLLAKSKCFKATSNITCSTCHGGHENAAISLKAYSQKCLNCHTVSSKKFCTATPAAGTTLQQNCIDCHMPLQSSKAIDFYLAGDKTRTAQQYRTHQIAIYPSVKQ